MIQKLAGIELDTRYSTDEDSSSPHLLCLHGIGGDHNSFRPQLDFLARRYSVSAWNMPGYRSSTSLTPLTFSNLAARVVELIDALELSAVHLVGQSIGGMIAQEVALKAPERVSSMVLIATTSAFGGKDKKFQEEFLKSRLSPLQEGSSMADLARQAIPSVMGSSSSPETQQAAIDSMQDLKKEVYEDVLHCLVTFNRRDEIELINQPVCLIAGGEDTNAPAKTMKKMSMRFPNAQFHTIKGAGHLTNLENPSECNRLIENFIDSVNS